MKHLLLLLSACLCFLGCGKSKEQLHIYTWANFFAPELIEEFEKRYDCDVIIDTYDSNESLYAKLQLGARGYDIIVPSNYFIELMHSQNMLDKIEKDAIVNRQHIDPYLDNLLGPELAEYAVPYIASYAGIGWRNDRLPDLVPSWNVFARKDLKGRMTMLNDPRETIAAALLYHGYSVNTLNPAELNTAKETLIGWKRNLAKLENEQYKNGIASGEYLVVHGYSGDIYQVILEDERISFQAPLEGITASIDYLAIPQGAKNKKLAETFINYALEEEPALQNTLFMGLLVMNTKIYSKLPEKMQEICAPFLTPSRMKRVQFIKYLGKDSNLYNTLWDEVKAAN